MAPVIARTWNGPGGFYRRFDRTGNEVSRHFWKKPAKAHRATPVLRCSFCNKFQEDVRKLIAGPAVFICDECVEVCNDIIADDARLSVIAEAKADADAMGPPNMPVRGFAVQCALCRMPVPVDEGMLIPNRGVLCPGCVGAIEASVADRRPRDL